MIKTQEKNKCIKNPNVSSLHQFLIIKGSGKLTGIPKWICVHCNITVETS